MQPGQVQSACVAESYSLQERINYGLDAVREVLWVRSGLCACWHCRWCRNSRLRAGKFSWHPSWAKVRGGVCLWRGDRHPHVLKRCGNYPGSGRHCWKRGGIGNRARFYDGGNWAVSVPETIIWRKVTQDTCSFITICQRGGWA